MFIPILFGNDLEGAEYESSFFGTSQFDSAVKALKAYFVSLKSSEALSVSALTKKMLADYVEISLQYKAAYEQSDLETWLKRIMAKGYTRASSLIFLAGLRKLHTSGSVGEAVYNPFQWTQKHPEDLNFFEQFKSSARSTYWHMLLLGAAALAITVVPSAIAKGFAKGIRK